MQIDLRENPPPPDWGVTIDPEAVERLARRLSGHTFERASFDYEGVPPFEGAEWATFVVLGVSVVWRLWPPEGAREWWVVDGDVRRNDAPGIWACFTRQPSALDLGWHASGGADDGFFGGDGVLQDVSRRVERMREVAVVILDHHKGSAMRLVEEGEWDAQKVSDVLTRTIPGYFDRPESPLGPLSFDKLSNLAAAMLAARLPITGVDRLPVYPDYMLPRHLRHEGILNYRPDLAHRVDTGGLLEAGSLEEMAIRWATIRAADMLETALAEHGNPVATPDLDYWLWSEAVIGPRAGLMGRHHLCLTEAY